MNEIYQIMVYGTSAMLVIFLWKTFIAKWPIPGISQIVAVI